MSESRTAAPWVACTLVAWLLVGGCAPSSKRSSARAATGAAAHSSSIAIDAQGQTLFAVNPEADSVSIVSVSEHRLEHEVLLADSRPSVDPQSGDYTPRIMPRALALSPDGQTLYVTGERSGRLYAVDVADSSVARSVNVGSEPVGVLASADGDAVYVACSQDGTVARVDAKSFQVTESVAVGQKPWALALAPDTGHLLVSHLLSGEVSVLVPDSMKVLETWQVPDRPPRGDRRLAHGEVRGSYDLAARPGTGEVWVVQQLLATDTAQPALDFESTVFPAVSVLGGDGAYQYTLSTDAADVPGIDGAFSDVVSEPRALQFSRDGDYAFVLDAASEDVLVVDADLGTEVALLRPLPGHLPQGLVVSPDGDTLYIDEANTLDIAVAKIEETDTGVSLRLQPDPIAKLADDPMPAKLRLGEHLFYSANSDEYAITQNHWVACASCHIEGRSDAVTWRFEVGPRDTPSNAGGTLGTGFLLRTADRTQVQDYWQTINVEQGGQFDPDNPAQRELLDAIAAYVNHAIPLPVPPQTDPALVEEGRELFESAEVGCATCHSGPRLTDSGEGNPDLDLSGPIELHDVGTCATDTEFDDREHVDIDGEPRAACAFDTPSLNGVADSPPYFHDGSAATLHDTLEMTRGTMGDISGLSEHQITALIEYMRSL